MTQVICARSSLHVGVEETIRPREVNGDRFDRSRRIDWLDMDAIFHAKVLMVGAGALGNEVGKNLVLSGFRDVTVVDMDRIVASNLSRCLFFTDDDASESRSKAEVLANGMGAIADRGNIKALSMRIEDCPPSTFEGSDVVIGCLDNILARMHVNSTSYAAGKLFVDGGMEGFSGRVMVVRPPDGACLQCGMNRSHARVARLRFSCTGAETTFHVPRVASEITTTSLLASVMVREVVKHVSDRGDLMISNAFYYDGKTNRTEEYEVSLDPRCPVHHPGAATGTRNS